MSVAGRWDAASLAAERIVGVLVGIVVGVILARHLGPHEFGRLSLAMALVGIATMFAQLGMSRILIAAIVRDGANTAAWVREAMRLRLLAACLAWAGVLCAGWLLGTGTDGILLTAVLGLGLLGEPTQSIYDLAIARGQARRGAMATVATRISGAGLRIILALLGASVVAFAAAGALERLLLAGILLLYAMRTGMADPAPRRVDGAAMLRSALPVLGAGMCSILYQRIDQAMLQSMAGFTELGHYAVSVRIYESLVGVIAGAALAVYPRMVRLHDSDPEAYRRQYIAWSAGLALPVLLGALLIGACGEPLVVWCFGGAYAASAPILTLHLLSAWVMAATAMRAGHLNIIGMNRWLLASTAIALVANVGANLVSIPRWGGIGAAAAGLATQSLSLLLLDLLPVRTRMLASWHLRALTMLPALSLLRRKPRP